MVSALEAFPLRIPYYSSQNELKLVVSGFRWRFFQQSYCLEVLQEDCSNLDHPNPPLHSQHCRRLCSSRLNIELKKYTISKYETHTHVLTISLNSVTKNVHENTHGGQTFFNKNKTKSEEPSPNPQNITYKLE